MDLRAVALALLLLATAAANAAAARPPGRLLISSCASPPEGDHRRIETMLTDGSHRRLLVAIPTDPFFACGDFAATWSPSGRRIAFRSGGQLEITDSRLRHRRTVGTGLFDAVWSPTGRRFAVTLFQEPGSRAVGTVGSDGRGRRLITPWSPDSFRASDWSSDGRRVLFERHTPHDPRPVGMWSVRPNGAGARLLGYGWDPQWSPDRRRLAYREPVDHNDNLKLARPDGRHARLLTHHKGYFTIGRFSWSPDGRYLAYPFDAERLPVPEIRIITRRGRLVKRIRMPLVVGRPDAVDWGPR